jgi:hypothetical protein
MKQLMIPDFNCGLFVLAVGGHMQMVRKVSEYMELDVLL